MTDEEQPDFTTPYWCGNCHRMIRTREVHTKTLIGKSRQWRVLCPECAAGRSVDPGGVVGTRSALRLAEHKKRAPKVVPRGMGRSAGRGRPRGAG